VRIAVLGATGNAGTSLLRTLADDDQVTDVVGIARRLPTLTMPKVEWARADISTGQ